MIGPIVLQVVLIFLNATFASAEIAVISMNEVRLRKLAADGDKRAVRLTMLTEQPACFLATIQVAITLAGLLGSAFAADNFAGPLVMLMVNAGVSIPERVLNLIAVFVITLILAYFNLVFGELVPKRIAMKKAESMALGMSGILHSVSRVFAPLVFLLTVSTNLVLRILHINPEGDEERISEEEIRLMLMEGRAQGTIDAVETEMIQNVFEFDDITAEHICTRRRDVILLEMDDDVSKWDEIIHDTRHSLYPVCGESVDDVIGILDTKDYFRLADKSKESIMANAVDSAYYMPETIKANVLFRQMKASRVYFAVIIDEYGGMTGIVTLHDLVSTLMGEIYDTEGEEPVPAIVKTDDDEWSIQGYANLDDVKEELNVSLPVEIYDTFSGFICGEVGRVPNDGESFELETHGLKIQVHVIENHKVGATTVWRGDYA